MPRLAMRIAMRDLRLLTVFLSLSLLGNAQNDRDSKLAEGFWLTDGYGELVQFDGTALRTYELTSISCIPAQTRQRDETRSSNSIAVFPAGNSVITIRRTDDPNIMHMRWDWAAADIILRRTGSLPEQCKQNPPDTPQKNYAVFWQTFAEQYPFFALRKVDWHAVDQQYRYRVTPAITSKELFHIFQQMIEPLNDTHTSLEARDIKMEFEGWRPDAGHLSDPNWKKAASVIETTYVQNHLRAYCKERIQFGLLRNSIGYLRVTTFYDYADGSYADELQCLQRSLDSIFGSAGRLEGLVIDVRLNKGGDDPLGIEIASRLTDKKYLAYAKAARNSTSLDAPLTFSEKQPVWVVPSARPSFKGKVALLIGPDTVSAGETFTMALMGREPHVLRIGLNTQGVFSDVLDRALPDGWHFGLPNEVYYTQDGKAFDATGVPPDIHVPFFTPTDLLGSRDAALEEAIREQSN
jgi:Peptidase family S41/Tricorn protease C1 domain